MAKNIALIVCIITAGSALAASASASEPRTHDGFFLRMGLNVGPLGITEKLELNGQEQPGEAEFSGLTPGFDLMMGGTPAEGFVLGGALVTTRTSDPTVEAGGVERTADGSLLLAGVAVFGNYYLDPTEGLHFQGMLGLGALDFVDEQGRSGGNDPTGWFLGIGAGYDFWVGDEWSIGPFGRLLYGSFSSEEGAAKVKESYLYPSIGVAFTLH